jgi:hypothetical protein
MKRTPANQTSPVEDSTWDAPIEPTTVTADVWDQPTIPVADAPLTRPDPQAINRGSHSAVYDMEGLMTDFPTATELERFVYDQTGIVLMLKGRANKLKYQVAMSVLNGETVDPAYIGTDNPYLDKIDLVPEDPLKPIPARDASLPDQKDVQNSFYSPFVPHPDPEYRARGKKCMCLFRKYRTGAISFEVLGPIDKYPVGSKIDKYGRERPEIVRYNDPRTGEQVLINSAGQPTAIGKRLKAMMQSMRVNKGNQWSVWIDREFASLNGDAISNPWNLN